ncbi:hypothetical protein WJX81_006055 [Elliptochloris bilobata]|uniref:Carbonic anhydrase n=1 Tax=Elliptochloris bilobata TaxID=381761 RepID=A0AAW1RPW5_9CHLO
MEALLGEAAGDVLVIRSHGSIVSEGIATAVALAVKDRGARLVGVIGHTECAAARAAIQTYLDEVAFAWPWKPAARTSVSSTASSSEEKCVFDTSEADAKAAAAAVEAKAARAKPLGIMEYLLSGCMIGAGWDEDESMHGVHGGRLYWDACCEPERSRTGKASGGDPTCSGAAPLGNTLAQAVEELSGSRISEAGRRWRDERAACAQPKQCLSIEAPRARRVYNCSIERSDSQKAAMAAAQREAISATPDDIALVARGSAKLAAASLLRAMAKQLPRVLASRLRVCALDCNGGTGALSTLRTGWYHNRCYFFE